MYGTVARMRVKPGTEAHLLEQMRDFEAAQVPGAVSVSVYRTDADSNEYFIAVAFTTKEAYLANAHSAAQHARYEKYAQLLTGEPEWHDGEIIYSNTNRTVPA